MAISEQLVSEADVRTVAVGGGGEAHTRSGTVQLALNEADRCTGALTVGVEAAVVDDDADASEGVGDVAAGVVVVAVVGCSCSAASVIGVEAGRRRWRRTGGVGGVVVVAVGRSSWRLRCSCV